MGQLAQVRHLSIAIDCPPGRVYEFVANPENLPKWAVGLGTEVRRKGAAWEVTTLQGSMGLRFAPHNELGVLDHYVQPAGVPEVHVPIRVLANGAGSAVVFTVFRQPGMSDLTYSADAEMVRHDLETLKAALEQ
jgi:hypothetical protein